MTRNEIVDNLRKARFALSTLQTLVPAPTFVAQVAAIDDVLEAYEIDGPLPGIREPSKVG